MPDNTPSWKEKARQILWDLYMDARFEEFGGHPSPASELPAKALQSINSAVKELVNNAKPDEMFMTTRLVGSIGSFNQAIDEYQANIIKAIDGKAE